MLGAARGLSVSLLSCGPPCEHAISYAFSWHWELRWFLVWVVTNSAAKNIPVHVFWWTWAHISVGDTPGKGAAGFWNSGLLGVGEVLPQPIPIRLAHGFRTGEKASRAYEWQSRTLSPAVKTRHAAGSGIPHPSNWCPWVLMRQLSEGGVPKHRLWSPRPMSGG